MTQPVSPVIDPAHVLRAYLWRVLKANDPDIWTEDNYNGLNPIVPLGEEPELSEFPGPHIIYVHNHSASNGSRSYGGMTLVIFDDDFRRLGKTINIIRTALDRNDESAKDINRFSSNLVIDSAKPFLGIRFGWVRTIFSEGATPPETEGGRASASLDIDYEYYLDYSVVTVV